MSSSIDELAETVRVGLDQDERFARGALGLLGIVTPWHTPQQLKARGLTRGDALHAARMSPTRVMAEVAARRALLDEVLAWPHERNYREVDCWAVLSPGRMECDCGRDDRIRAVLECIAAPYRERP